jgi:hypothetical protein
MHDILTSPTDSGCSKLVSDPSLPVGPLIGKRSVGLQRGHHTTRRCAGRTHRIRIKRAVPWREAPLFIERTEAR